MTNLMNLGENLSKKEMNNVVGGGAVYCIIYDKNGHLDGFFNSESAMEIQDRIPAGGSATCY